MAIFPDADEEETLYRVIKRSFPDFIKRRRNGTIGISSACFKDKNGVSVGRKIDRSEDDVKQAFGKVFKTRMKGMVKLFGKDVENAKAILLNKPSRDDPYHAEIHKNDNEIELDDLQALQLADTCHIIYIDEDWIHDIRV